MGSLYFWTLIAVLYQTIICIIIAWLTLGCKLAPDLDDLHEITLMKMLYFYDPVACGQVYLYNFSFHTNEDIATICNVMVMPQHNPVSAQFRETMKLYVALHCIWSVLAIVSLSQGQRDCGFYTVLLPFTLVGVAILVTDIIYVAFFLADAMKTQTDVDILKYINAVVLGDTIPHVETGRLNSDTSWVALLCAFVCSRGIVQWFLNLWIIQDMYFDGLTTYRRAVAEKIKERDDYK